jgi:hypothetical protein
MIIIFGNFCELSAKKLPVLLNINNMMQFFNNLPDSGFCNKRNVFRPIYLRKYLKKSKHRSLDVVEGGRDAVVGGDLHGREGLRRQPDTDLFDPAANFANLLRPLFTDKVWSASNEG